MSWREEYERKIMTAQEALSLIHSGDRVAVQHAAGEPSYLLEVMVANREQYRGVEIVHQVPMGKCEYCKEGMEPYFRHNSIFSGKNSAQAIAEGRADYTPCFNFEIPKLFTEGPLPLDAALIHVTPPDEDGYVSLGISVDYTRPAVTAAKTVIAQVNQKMPRTFGDALIHISEITAFVLHDAPIIELTPPKIGEIERAIGENCAKLIHDGDTLQLGIGAIPDAVLMFLKDKKDLGIHSEMISDGVVELAEAGVITNARKNFNPGKSIVTFLMGTRRLYDYVDNNPNIIMRSVDYVTNPTVIMQNDHMISINSCVQVDLTGQVCSESIGHRQISGPGGQVDFVRGATMSKGGKSIIAMPSTTKGTISKIVMDLTPGSFVTTSRNDVDYVVTEYGIAHLKGRTLLQRGKMLIQIAHPDFREDLIRQYEERYHCRYEEVAV